MHRIFRRRGPAKETNTLRAASVDGEPPEVGGEDDGEDEEEVDNGEDLDDGDDDGDEEVKILMMMR